MDGLTQAAALVEHVSLKRPGTVEEVAEAIVFIASNKASFITGATLSVDGGQIARVAAARRRSRRLATARPMKEGLNASQQRRPRRPMVAATSIPVTMALAPAYP